MTLLQMRYFQSVYEKQSISRTSEALNVSQPTVSKSIQSLEWELGISLFSRVRNRIIPTEAGHLLYNESKKITLLYDQLLSDMQQFQAKSNLLNVGVGSMSNLALSRAIQDFSLKNQNVSVHHRRKIILIIDMTVCGVHRFSFDGKDTVICHNRELQNHLVHLSLTVSAYGNNFIFILI